LVGLAAVGPAPRLRAEQPDPAAVVAECFRSEWSASRSPGAAMAVLLDGQVVFEQALGLKRHDDPAARVDTATQFRIGSSTKTFTAAGVMRLVDRGRVDLDAPIVRYLPEIRFAEPGAEARVTIRHLLQHTSGLPDNSATGEADLYGAPDASALGRWALAQAGTWPNNPPGRFYNYSSANYMYLGAVIERVSGLGYPEYMRREVFEPAGLGASTLVASEVEARGNYALGHWNDIFHGGTLRVWKPTDQDNWARHPTGNLHTTPRDVVQFLDRLMDDGGGLLAPASAALLQAPQVDTHERAAGRSYGFGTLTERFGDLTMKHHNGSAWGWFSSMRWVPKRRFAVSVLSNGYHTFDGTADCAMNAWLAPGGGPSEPSCPRQPERWADWVGHYAGRDYVGAAWQADVSQDAGGALRARFTLPDGPRPSAPLTQSCGDARANGPAGFVFDYDGNGGADFVATFIDDPVEPGVVWLRHRQVVLRRGPAAPTPSPSPTAAPSPTAPPPSPAVGLAPRCFLPLTLP
jgi:CubicO group peptidase (beta-lactamase class C family)